MQKMIELNAEDTKAVVGGARMEGGQLFGRDGRFTRDFERFIFSFGPDRQKAAAS
jgi:hypothetical protein